MALPDYFDRNAIAAAQAIAGLDKDRLAHQLDRFNVGVTLGADADTNEGRALADLLIRLLCRLYPRVTIRGARQLVAPLEALAHAINPRIESGGEPTIDVIIGSPRLRRSSATRIFAGSTGWVGHLSTRPVTVGNSTNPFGAGVAACLAAANVFRHAFLANPDADRSVSVSALAAGESADRMQLRGVAGQLILVGAGAIGSAAAWSLARVPMRGELHIVDHERVDLGNLQRYVMTLRPDVEAPKSRLLADQFDGAMTAKPFELDLASFLQANGYEHQRMLLALDSARDRRAAQASLPRWIANAWTQPGDLGVSAHDFLTGACVSCLYLPDKPSSNEDQIVADALGVPDRIQEVRTLLFRGDGTPRALLEAIAAARTIELERLLPFEGRPVRSLYVEGFCGGAVIPLGEIGSPRSDVHVPLAHQSALAGVLLAAAAVRNVLGGVGGSRITQLDVLKALPAQLTRPAAKSGSGRCICQDADYQGAYKQKYHQLEPTTPQTPLAQ